MDKNYSKKLTHRNEEVIKKFREDNLLQRKKAALSSYEHKMKAWNTHKKN